MFNNFHKITWYPGHMHWATKLLYKNLKKIDLYVEIRDARAPLSTFNKNVDTIVKEFSKEKIIIFNKYDLCNKTKT